MDGSNAFKPSPADPPKRDRPMHRLGEVRRREGLTRRNVAKRLGMQILEVEKQETSSSDILLSEMHRWQKALNVPIAELLIEPNGGQFTPARLRTRLLRAMKTVRSIENDARQASIRRLAEMLIEQLVEIMPNLKNTAPWGESEAQSLGMKERFEWHFPFENKWT